MDVTMKNKYGKINKIKAFPNYSLCNGFILCGAG